MKPDTKAHTGTIDNEVETDIKLISSLFMDHVVYEPLANFCRGLLSCIFGLFIGLQTRAKTILILILI